MKLHRLDGQLGVYLRPTQKHCAGTTANRQKVGWQFQFFIRIIVISVNTVEIYFLECFSLHVNTNCRLLVL